MAPPDPPAIAFLDEDGNEYDRADEVGDAATTGRPPRRLVVLDRWVPEGGGGAIAALVLVLVAWIGAQPLVLGVTALFPQDLHRIGPLSEQSIQFGNGQYYGVTPGLVPVISFGTRIVIVVVALVLAGRSRRHEHSPLATGAAAAAAISLLLFALGGAAMVVGFALGHAGNFYGSTF